ncbi:unnamed protein product [Brassicogethes aeneus]|uniref:Nose resistant-to-fluoxetine protein N-terminal domain-containing protein n=1 Tax=Brassicogethes aeneus TaxID=1431903 RepID=A0A9P0AY51_BRAAE|nr:unnamed protein product [Brassicogethes aeneus]
MLLGKFMVTFILVHTLFSADVLVLSQNANETTTTTLNVSKNLTDNVNNTLFVREGDLDINKIMDETRERIKEINHGENVTDNLIIKGIKFFYNEVFKTENVHNVSKKCFNALNKSSVFTKTQLIDAGSTIPGGALAHSVFNLGFYDECLKTHEVIEGKAYHGKYCIGRISSELNIFQRVSKGIDLLNYGYLEGISLSYCLLDPCNAEDFNKIFSHGMFYDEGCYTNAQPPKFDKYDKVAIIVLIIFGLLTVFSTSYDIYLYYSGKEPYHIFLIAFSLWTNGRKILFNTSSTSKFSCITGVKSLSMAWVIISHIYVLHITNSANVNPMDILDYALNPKNLWMNGSSVACDSFLAVGGLLTVHSFLKAAKKGNKINVPSMYIHRYLRLTPAYAILVMLEATLIRYMGSGPFWAGQFIASKRCQEDWWAALLYIQTYVHPDQMCAAQTWYLSVDMQLFFLSPLVIIPILKWPKQGTIALGVLLFLGFLIPFLFVYLQDFPVGFTLELHKNRKYFRKYYVQTYVRFGPYVVGMVFGLIILKLQTAKEILRTSDKNKKWVAFGVWICVLTGLLGCVYCGEGILLSQQVYSALSKALYASFVRNGWAICVCTMITLCVLGYGGPINAFLSLPIFQIISRLTYSMYLLHFMFIINAMMRSSRVPYFFLEENLYFEFWTYFMVTFIAAFFFSAIFESPVITIEKIIFGGVTKKPSNKEQDNVIKTKI